MKEEPPKKNLPFVLGIYMGDRQDHNLKWEVWGRDVRTFSVTVGSPYFRPEEPREVEEGGGETFRGHKSVDTWSWSTSVSRCPGNLVPGTFSCPFSPRAPNLCPRVV